MRMEKESGHRRKKCNSIHLEDFLTIMKRLISFPIIVMSANSRCGEVERIANPRPSKSKRRKIVVLEEQSIRCGQSSACQHKVLCLNTVQTEKQNGIISYSEIFISSESSTSLKRRKQQTLSHLPRQLPLAILMLPLLTLLMLRNAVVCRTFKDFNQR